MIGLVHYRKSIFLTSLIALTIIGGSLASWHVLAQRRGERMTARSDPESTQASGDLDGSFGPVGPTVPPGVSRVFFGANSAAGFEEVFALGVQALGSTAGKVVAAGVSQPSGTPSDEALVRFNTDGTVASSTTTDFGGTFEQPNDLAIDPTTDEIYTVGFTSVAGGVGCSNNNFTIAKYTSAGTLDATFATAPASAGKITKDFDGCSDIAHAVVVQPDHNIVVLGEATRTISGVQQQFITLSRYLPTGAVDPSFNGGQVNTSGTVEHLNSSASSVFGSNITLTLYDLAVLNSGKFVAVGKSTDKAVVVQFNSNGSLDSGGGGFAGGAGFLFVDWPGGANDSFNSVAIQSDGKILALGTAENTGQNPQVGDDFGLARLTSAGALDGSFGGAVAPACAPGGGLCRVDFFAALQAGSGSSLSTDKGKAVRIDSLGRIIVIGQANGDSGTVNSVGVARLTTAGSFDNTFSGDGKVTSTLTSSTPNNPDVQTGGIQPNGKILAGGGLFAGGSDMFVARFLNATQTAANVSVSGMIVTSDGRGVTNAQVMITAPDGTSQITITQRNGRFTFDNIETGQSYIVSIGSRRFSYEPQSIFVSDNVNGLIFSPQ